MSRSIVGAFAPKLIGTPTADAVASVGRDTSVPEWYRSLPQPIETKRLSDGTTGYAVRHPRGDDCLAAALATVLQVPIGEVPDPRLDERLAAGETVEEIDRSAWRELHRWLTTRGLRMIVHRKIPAPRRRWIGVVSNPGAFENHCLVMTRAALLFDPVVIPERLTGMPSHEMALRIFRPDEITYGLSFQSTNSNGSDKT